MSVMSNIKSPAHSQKSKLVPKLSNSEPLEILANQATLINLKPDTRNSLCSDISNYSNENERWSLRSLKKEFKEKNVSKMFVKYQARLQHTFFMVLLLLNIFFSVIAIVIYFFDNKDNSFKTFPGHLLLKISSLIVFIIFFAITCCEELLLRPRISRTVAGITVLLAMIFEEYGSALFPLDSQQKTFALHRIRPTFYIIVSNHILLPFSSRLYSCLSTILVIGIELSLTFRQRFEMSCESHSIIKFTVADLIFYLFSALYGFYMTFLLEIAIRRAFMNHRSCVESTFKLELEQEQQEQLLNSCFPRHLIEDVRNDIRITISKIARQEAIPLRPFNTLYVKKYKNVSILYADIVNSMILTASLSPHDLVETLNELFGRFDESAERNHCLRIKLLGDCYYCVSGLPDEDKNHAMNCVRMGLDMIKTIRAIREDRKIDIDMRIGIHSGMVLSGIMGLHKWQYDIWSLDSVQASAMEHNGVPGFVHITQTTLDLIPEEQKKNLMIREKITDGEVGYLIAKKEVISHNRKNSGSPNTKRKKQTETLKAHINKLRRRSYEPQHMRMSRTILESSLNRYREMISSVNKFMDSAIEEMPLNIKSHWRRPQDIHPFFLSFTSGVIGNKGLEKKEFSIWNTEKIFAQQNDPFFKFYLFCGGALCITMAVIKLTIPELNVLYEMKICLALTLLVIILSIVYTHYVSHQLSIYLRISIWFLISSLLMICSMIDVIVRGCEYSLKNQTDLQEISDLANCAYSWDYTMCVILAMTGVSLFIRIHLWLKFLMQLLEVVVYIIIFHNKCSIYQYFDRKKPMEQIWTSIPGHIYYVVMVAVLLHLIDRQIEYIFRLDFKWTNRLIDERNEMQTMGEINRILLENILPVHVAQRYLYNSSVSADQLYHESYDSCAVMFASIPNYSQFYSENYMNESGLKCLQLLNEIILNFDQMLSYNGFQRIEKIKTIGSTYMAASGLQPGRGSTDSEISIEDERKNITALVCFATALMETLKKLNKDALQDFKLRVGIAVGPVVAGVVGAVKPQYDIWGDTVNVASRMESTGIMGRIQVTEEAANILSECENSNEFVLEERGLIFVKGKGELKTFLVKTQFDFDENEITRV